MTESRLDEIRERHDKIIPGPWDWFGNTATDQVFLGTPDRGRLFILTPGLRNVEYVYDSNETEGYELEEARQRVHTNWCLAHAEHVDKDDPGECICDELRDFLRGTLDPSEGHRYFEREDRGYRVSLVRAVQVFPDLRFAGEGKDAFGGRKQQGAVQRSYRETGVRYEVLGYRTVVEWEMDQGGVVPSADGDIRNFLYREDFRGIDNPEAEFIAHAPEDTDYLLKRLEAAEKYVDALQHLALCENRGQQFQSTIDARGEAARKMIAWEGTK